MVSLECMFSEIRSLRTVERHVAQAVHLPQCILGCFNWLCFYGCSSIHGRKPHLICAIVSRLQKLALRNNSASTTQHLRLLVRGQDQDCFQVCGVHGSVLCQILLRSGCLVLFVLEESVLLACFVCAAALSYTEVVFEL